VLDERELSLKVENDRIADGLISIDAAEQRFYESARKYFPLARSAWEKYCENDCLAQTELVMTGTARGIVHLRCKISHTDARIATLELWPKQ
jgi:uncharacterized protein YecT (DUF1311 family)